MNSWPLKTAVFPATFLLYFSPGESRIDISDNSKLKTSEDASNGPGFDKTLQSSGKLTTQPHTHSL